MSKLKYFVLLGTVMLGGCKYQDIPSDRSLWAEYYLNVLEGDLAFSLPPAGQLIVKPSSFGGELGLDKEFHTLFFVGYDYGKNSNNNSEFDVVLQLKKYGSKVKLPISGTNEFVNAFVLTHKERAQNAVNYPLVSRDTLEIVKIKGREWVHSTGQSGESYSLAYTKCCFLTLEWKLF